MNFKTLATAALTVFSFQSFANDLSKYKCVKTITYTHYASDEVYSALDGMEKKGSSSTSTNYRLIKNWFAYDVPGCNTNVGVYDSLNGCVDAFKCKELGANEFSITGPGLSGAIYVYSNISTCKQYIKNQIKTNKVNKKYRTVHPNSGSGSDYPIE